MERKGKKLLIIKIVFAAIGIVSGVSVFISFIAVRNINAAIWGFLSAVFAAINLSLHIAHRRDVFLRRFPIPVVRSLKHFAIFGSFAATVSAVTYFSLAVALKQGYKLEDDGYMPAGIFSLLTLKWTAFLICHSKNYEKIYTNDGELHPIANGQ